ncbi:hypothetical protein [Corallococcus carmarthensis]|uniref:hypothetical protein n=1 Tax=Corallococcus carmarthensis TaxID=2316728 RepID=UPI00131516B6|nr:hypothetical protein [Corallococcus carmarthensis]NOK20161.1 hypothetical protein [Corallococcus carmarthensis]
MLGLKKTVGMSVLDVAKKAQADAGMALQKAFKAAPATQTGMGGSGTAEPVKE